MGQSFHRFSKIAGNFQLSFLSLDVLSCPEEQGVISLKSDDSLVAVEEAGIECRRRQLELVDMVAVVRSKPVGSRLWYTI